jgi:hypothetical protein
VGSLWTANKDIALINLPMPGAMKKSLAAGIYALWVCRHRVTRTYLQRIFSLRLATGAGKQDLT